MPRRIYYSDDEMIAAGLLPQDIVVRPSIEDILKDTEKWNADWERAMDPANGFTPILWYEREIQARSRFTKELLDASFAGHPIQLRQTLDLQILFFKQLIIFRGCQLEEKWMDADPASRRKHVLIGLTSSCSGAHNLHEARKFCPTELSVPRLTRDGKYMLELLQLVFPEDMSAPTRVKHFPHPDWDVLREHHEKSNPDDLGKLCFQEMLVLRTKLICFVLHNTLRSFFGLEMPSIHLSKVHRLHEKFRPGESKKLIPPGAKLVRSGCELKTCPNGMYNAVNIPKERQFLRCKDCWANFKREVKYCSRECQKADWKPNHKAICGKPLDFAMMEKIVVSETPAPSRFTPVVGPAVAGFTRSKALTCLISQLRLQPQTDYLITPPNEPTIRETESVIDFVDPEIKALFRTFRDKALTTGDREAVAVMAHALCWWVCLDGYKGGVTPEMIAEDIYSEFGFESVKVAILDMQMRQARDVHKRPPFLLKMDPTRWMGICQRHRANQIKCRDMSM